MMEKKVRLSRQDAKAQRKTQAEKSRGRRVMPPPSAFFSIILNGAQTEGRISFFDIRSPQAGYFHANFAFKVRFSRRGEPCVRPRTFRANTRFAPTKNDSFDELA
jgi:hypothetical protein